MRRSATTGAHRTVANAPTPSRRHFSTSERAPRLTPISIDFWPEGFAADQAVSVLCTLLGPLRAMANSTPVLDLKPTPARASWLDRPLSGWWCALGWCVATGIFIGLIQLLGGPSGGDAFESIYSTWAVAHGYISCIYPPHPPTTPTFAAPMYPLVSGRSQQSFASATVCLSPRPRPWVPTASMHSRKPCTGHLRAMPSSRRSGLPT
jgi:hypothetical protein